MQLLQQEYSFCSADEVLVPPEAEVLAPPEAEALDAAAAAKV